MNNGTALDVLALLKKMEEGVNCECFPSIRQSGGETLVLEWRFFALGSGGVELPGRYSYAVMASELRDANVDLMGRAISLANEHINA